MGDVVTLDCVTTVDMPAEKILQSAIEAKLCPVLVIGLASDGELYVASTTSRLGDNLILAERARDFILGQTHG